MPSNKPKPKSKATPAKPSPPPTAPSVAWKGPLFVVLYVIVVLGVDTLAVSGVSWPIRWSMFQWTPHLLRIRLQGLGLPGFLLAPLHAWPLQKFDVFKFLFWFLIPFLVSLRRMDWGALGVKRWKKIDVYLLVGLMAAGMIAVFIIPYVAALRQTYHPLGHLSGTEKVAQFVTKSMWVFSWLIGWEFLHRYFLLRPMASLWPRVGWLIVPLSEGVYHLQKPMIEGLGMVALSIILTQWSLRRRNVLLPFLVHLAIEIELIVFLLLR